ncbi:hypothetical protein J2X16_003193 [Pelomonas aquatica]|uniref:Transposase n=1 Tax=Pelomonas aquatica TaxID=431058 RepID=A0ABU1ZB38_9BURK|nr:hypothetical protein [Pelomonas aquatica]
MMQAFPPCEWVMARRNRASRPTQHITGRFKAW